MKLITSQVNKCTHDTQQTSAEFYVITTATININIIIHPPEGMSHTFFLQESCLYGSGVLAKSEVLRSENSMLAIISNYGMSMHNLSALTH